MAIYNPSYTQFLMNKYGVAWFKFDETSGNVIDSKGINVGIVNGATRVAGWNDLGYALSFNGSANVSFSSYILPSKRSLRFKIKTTSTRTEMIFCTATDSTKHGIQIYLHNKGVIFIQELNAVSGSPIFSLSSSKLINDGNWHDVYYKWDGTIANRAELYVDDMFNVDGYATAKSAKTVNDNGQLCVGNVTPSSALNLEFHGELDEVEIYNDIINPSSCRFQFSSGAEISSTSGAKIVKLDGQTDQNFFEYGLTQLNIAPNYNGIIDVKRTSQTIGTGKTFTHNIDLVKYKGKRIML